MNSILTSRFSKLTSSHQNKLISKQLNNIFFKDFNVTSTLDNAPMLNKFYVVLNKDRSLKLLFPFANNVHLLDYLSPTRRLSRIILFFLKLSYRLEILCYFPNIKVIAIDGLNNINWPKYAWNQKIPPNIFVIMGTVKDTQNAVIFLDSKKYPDQSLVLKVCINKICNLKNEYFTGKSISINTTEYVAFNEEERFLCQKYKRGFRAINELNNDHIDYLSKLISDSDSIKGSDIKTKLAVIVKRLAHFDEYNKLVIDAAINSINNKSYFYKANTHGDFAPYNIIYDSSSGNFSLIDWEQSSSDGLAAMDLFNYTFIRDCLFNNQGSKKLEDFIFKKAQRYFLNAGHCLTKEEFKDYKTIFLISEFMNRLKDAGVKDVYVKYLYEIIKNEY